MKIHSIFGISLSNLGRLGFVGLSLITLVFAGVLNSCSSGSVTGTSAGTSANGSVTIMSQRDTDGDGIIDLDDYDDDNDGISDSSDEDDDNDGIHDDDESDCDNDGTIDDHDDDYVEIYGVVSSVGDKSFILYGYTIVVDGETRYESEYENSFGFDSISTGMYLEVEGVLTGDRTVLAREVEQEDDDSSDDDHDDDYYDDGSSDGDDDSSDDDLS
jgi:hypothetical protein